MTINAKFDNMEVIILTFFRRVADIMSKIVSITSHSVISKKENNRKSMYSSFVIKRNAYSKTGKQSLVGTTIIERPSWRDIKDGEE